MALPKTSIDKQELLQLPLAAFNGPIEVVRDDRALPAAVEALRKETLLGFDTETKPVFVRGESHPPALLQLAGATSVHIFQLQKIRSLDPLLDLLSNHRIRKAGVALADDLKKLRAFVPFEPAGFTELGTMAKSLGIQQTGLRALAGLLMGIRISKREQRSNWSRDDLTKGQVTYAATDAWISRELCQRLEQLAREHPPAPVVLRSEEDRE